MSVGRPRRNSSSRDEVDEDGNILWHGVKLGEFWKTDMQVAINDSNRRKEASFTIRMGKAGTSLPYQQPIPADFARYHKDLFHEDITLEGPTGQTWTTILNPTHQVVRFGKGWRQFSIENHLQEGYQLLFTLVGGFRFLVHFFDHLGKRCTSYPPLPVALPVAETQRQPDLQPGFQQVMDRGQASHRHGSEGQTSAAVPLMGTTPNSAIPLNFDQDNVIPRQYRPELPPEPSLPHEHMREPEEHTFDAGNDSEDMETEDDETEDKDYLFLDSDSEDMETEDEETESLAEDLDSDNDDVPFCHPPATKPPLVKPDRKMPTLNKDHMFLDSDNDDVPFCHPPATKPPLVKPDRKMPTLNKDHMFLDSDNDDVPFCHPPATKPPLVKPDRKMPTLDELLDSDNDDVPFCHPPATKPPLVKPDRKMPTLNELLLRKKTKCNQANPPHMQRNDSSSSDDELPNLQKEVKKPVTRKKVRVKRRSPTTPPFAGSYRQSPATPPVAGSHDVGTSSRGSPAMHLLEQQGCMRFSDIVSKCKRRDVSDQERRMVRGAAERFASKLGDENFLVVMQDAQVYQGFHLAIPEKILEATGTERASKVEVCLLDREQALYKAHWTRENFYGTPFLDRDAWAKLAVDHTVEEGDVCVFQLLPQPLQSKPALSVATFHFLVHIFRVAEISWGQLDFSDAIDNN